MDFWLLVDTNQQTSWVSRPVEWIDKLELAKVRVTNLTEKGWKRLLVSTCIVWLSFWLPDFQREMIKRVCDWAKGERNEQLSAEAQKEVFAQIPLFLYSSFFEYHISNTSFWPPIYARTKKLALSNSSAIFIFYDQK